MRKLMITIFIFIAVVCSCACINSTDCNNEDDFTEDVVTVMPNTPIETVESIPEPKPIYFTEYRPKFILGAHDYYNSVVHKHKASINEVEVMIYSDCYSRVLYFDSIDNVYIPLNDLDCGQAVVAYIILKTDVEYASTSINNITLLLNVSLVNEELVVDCDIDEVVIDFVYDTTNIAYPLTEVERNLVSSLLAWEYGYKNQDDGQRAIISVVFNRLDYFGGTLHDIVYAKNQFTPSKLIDSETGLCESRDIFDYYTHCVDNVDYVAAYGVTIPRSVLYFRTDYYFNWSTVTNYTQIGNTCFSGLTKLIDKYDEWHHYRCGKG